jgi:hypothetical protein
MSTILKHIVLFKFIENTSQKEIDKITSEFLELRKKIPIIQSIEWGTDVSVEGKNFGFTHCFCLSFPDSKSRDEYLPHPAHKEFGKILKPHIEKVFVFDYFVTA